MFRELSSVMVNSVHELIRHAGGTSAVAKLLGIGPPAVSNWIARGIIPAEWYPSFEDVLPFKPPLRLFTFKRRTAA